MTDPTDRTDQPYDFGAAFRYYDSVRTSHDLPESDAASRIAESIAATLNARIASQSAEDPRIGHQSVADHEDIEIQNIEIAPPISDLSRDSKARSSSSLVSGRGFQPRRKAP